MVGWPGALEDRLPADALVARAGGAGVARRPREGRRAFGASARERSAAPDRRPGPVRRRRPGLVRCAGPVDPAAAVGRGLPGDTRDTAGLAPQAGRAEVRHEHPAPARPAADGAEHRPDRRPPREGEPAVGLPADPRRADQARPENRAIDHLRDPADRGHRPRAAKERPDMAAVPARKPPGSSPPITCTWTRSR